MENINKELLTTLLKKGVKKSSIMKEYSISYYEINNLMRTNDTKRRGRRGRRRKISNEIEFTEDGISKKRIIYTNPKFKEEVRELRPLGSRIGRRP